MQTKMESSRRALTFDAGDEKAVGRPACAKLVGAVSECVSGGESQPDWWW